jgi:hypothetical protein
MMIACFPARLPVCPLRVEEHVCFAAHLNPQATLQEL